jgi:hypothetical protein
MMHVGLPRDPGATLFELWLEIRPPKNMCVYCNMLKKMGSVGRIFFFF